MFDGFLQNRTEALLQIVLVIGCLGLGTYLADQLVWRADWTADQRYTLSDASQEIAETLNDPITVRAYFSDDLPPQLVQAEDEFRNFLDEFRAYAGGNLEYAFINPNADEESEIAAQQAGIQPVVLDVRERDQIVQQRAYLGAVFSYGDQQEVLPLIQPGAAMEYTIASTIKRLAATNRLRVGLLQGHGEPSLQALPQLIQQLQQQYDVVPVRGVDTAGVPPDVDVLLALRPTQPLPEATRLAIDQYVMRGGRLVAAVNRVDANLQVGQAQPLETGLETLLAAYGVTVQPNLVRDQSSSVVQVSQQQGFFNLVNQIPYPYLPLVVNFADHPVSGGLEAAVLQFASSLDVQPDTVRQTVTVLAASSEQAGIASGPFFNLDPMQEWQPSDFTEANLPFAALIEGTFASAFAGVDTLDVPVTESPETRLVVFGDGDFMVNGEGQQAQRLPADNINLLVNSIDYLSDETGLIALRTKGVTNRPLALLEDGTKTIIKYVNVLFPMLLVLGYGVVRHRRQQARRRQWQEVGV